ncbi:MAG: hypothetical protein V3T07_01155, partial [Myxococcota bacterium]
ELRAFAPNRLVYRARAERPGRIVFPFRYGRGAAEWRVEGLTAVSEPAGSEPAVSEGGKLAVDLPAGERDVVMVYRPRFFTTGWGTSVLTLLVVLGALIRSGRKRGRLAARRAPA